jgi:predicted negative regulator of RcsB-dependent stress response
MEQLHEIDKRLTKVETTSEQIDKRVTNVETRQDTLEKDTKSSTQGLLVAFQEFSAEQRQTNKYLREMVDEIRAESKERRKIEDERYLELKLANKDQDIEGVSEKVSDEKEKHSWTKENAKWIIGGLCTAIGIILGWILPYIIK